MCQEKGVCPTCKDLIDGGIYPDNGPRTFYENDHILCLLDQYPRNPGHSIVLVKKHYEDISELPIEKIGHIYTAIHHSIATLRKVIGAEKVYLCTMCDGKRNHLHYQLIPRLPGDDVLGSRLFVSARKVLENAEVIIPRLKEAMRILDQEQF